MTDTAPATVPAAQGGHPDEGRQRADARVKALEHMFGKDFVRSFQSPYMVMLHHKIECPVGIRLYKKDFQYLSRQLYVEYQFRTWYGFSRELLDRYADITNAKLTAIDTMLQQSINRIKKLLDQAGHKDELSLFPAPHITHVPIIASSARAYISALGKLDRLYEIAGTANLMGVIDSQQRAEVELISKKAFRAFRSILQNEVVKLYREASRVVADQHRKAGVVDPGMQQVVEQQGQDIEAFKQESDADDRIEPDMNLNGADPAQMIDDAAAASTAAAAAAVPPKKPRASRKADAPDAATSASASASAPAPGVGEPVTNP